MVQKSGSPVEVGSLSHYLQGFIHPRWLFGISSINSYVSLPETVPGNHQGTIFHNDWWKVPSISAGNFDTTNAYIHGLFFGFVWAHEATSERDKKFVDGGFLPKYLVYPFSGIRW